MKFQIKLKKIKSISRIEGYWTKEDYINLLELFEFPDAKSIAENELFEMLSLAISDYEPAEAAAIVLDYKLSEQLKPGQIKNLAHEMLQDKVAEEYPDISLHYPLFNVNQLLHDAYNGKFPRTIASQIDIELFFKDKVVINKEVVLRCISDLLSDRSLLKRLFDENLDSDQELSDAKSIIWELRPNGEHLYQIISSDYWMSNEDFEKDEYSGVLGVDEINH